MRNVLLLAVTLVACRTPEKSTTPIAPHPESTSPPPVEKRTELAWAYAAHAAAVPTDGPVIALDGRQITVDGAAVARTDGTVTMAIVEGFDDLTLALRNKRDAWRSAHAPTDPFPGLVVARVPARTEMQIVRLIVNSAAIAGYPWVHHVVRTGDGTREGAVQLGAAIPAPPNAPPRMVLHLGAKELTVLWSDAAVSKPVSISRELLRPSTAGAEPPATIVDGLRGGWTKAPSGAREWLIATRDCETQAMVVALMDAVAVARGSADVTVSLSTRAAPGECS